MRAFTVLLALVLASGLAFAHHGCETADPEVTLDTPAGTYYIDNDLCQFDGCLFSVWVYQESNGIPGLQRGDEVYGGVTSWCDSDTIIL